MPTQAVLGKAVARFISHWTKSPLAHALAHTTATNNALAISSKLPVQARF